MSVAREAAPARPATVAAVPRDAWAWLAVGALALACFNLRDALPWLTSYPQGWTVPLAAWLNAFMQWFVDSFRGLFRALSWLLEWPMAGIQGVLQWLPWPATLCGFTLLAYAASGWRLAAFTAAALFYMVVVGYWSESMATLSLVFVSVPLAVALGFALGVWAYRSERANRIVQPALDLMQTVPTFAYLIPILLLFGFGPVVGLIASAVYACPPMVRNMILGLQRVPSEVLESAQMSGTTRRQSFWWVQIPTAMPTIMIGVNQTTMAALSMVIIAAIIGGYADIGWEVLSTMRKARFGEALLAGIVIALIAMVMDRISRGFADQRRWAGHETGSLLHRHRFLVAALAAVAALSVVSFAVAPMREYPQAWVFYPAAPINDALAYVTVEYAGATEAVKRAVLFYFLLPLRIGLEKAVSPFSWGFALTPAMVWGYAIACTGAALWAGRAIGWRAGVGVVLLAGVVFFGVTRTPWPVVVAAITVLGWQVGGRRVAAFAGGGLLFMLLTGVWAQAMLSVYLCMAAVVVSLLLGSALGILAASNDYVSAFLRPINDTLQTMPLFVILIPFLMFFQVGEFTAFLSIIAYAIVPAIRYTEHGLRRINPETVEAARSMGCTDRQILWQVKLPLAIPEIMLGLNQTIMYALAMLVIAALVGTKGMGQLVYIALGQSDFGNGLVAGLGMALIAMIADRIIQSWSQRRKMALGL